MGDSHVEVGDVEMKMGVSGAEVGDVEVKLADVEVFLLVCVAQNTVRAMQVGVSETEMGDVEMRVGDVEARVDVSQP
jgi:hypothetical protein